MVKNRTNPLLPILTVFIILNVFFLTGKGLLERYGFNQAFLLVGNLILFLVTILSYYISVSSFKSNNPNVFVRSIYKTTMLKLFVIAIAAVIYIFTFRENLNKPSLITSMALYIVYTVIEVSVLTRILKGKKNA